MDDWLPRNHAELYRQAVMTRDYILVPANRTRMGFAPDTPQGVWFDTVFTPAFEKVSSCYANWQNPAERTPRITTQLQEAEAVFIPEYRQLYTGTLKNSPLVTDDELQGMGLPKRSGGGHTPVPAPRRHPAAEADTSELRRVTIAFFEDEDTHKKAKPHGVHGVEVLWAVFDHTQDVHISELTHSSFDTHTPLTLEFADEDRGKVLYFALRWENTRGEKGPFGPVLNAIIP
jgi:hypothetical protein